MASSSAKATSRPRPARCSRTLSTVLEQSGATLESIVKLTVYLTDMNKLRDYTPIKARFIEGEQPASTAIGVASLALPGMMIEIDATAVL
jgi:enamine deaminase RidA (YjgF/YER057c/UK114 family)